MCCTVCPLARQQQHNPPLPTSRPPFLHTRVQSPPPHPPFECHHQPNHVIVFSNPLFIPDLLQSFTRSNPFRFICVFAFSALFISVRSLAPCPSYLALSLWRFRKSVVPLPSTITSSSILIVPICHTLYVSRRVFQFGSYIYIRMIVCFGG